MIRYKSTTYIKGSWLIALGAIVILLGLYVFSVYAVYGYQIPSYKNANEHDIFFYWMLLGVTVIPVACLILFTGNVIAVWEISEKGIHESITPKWKKIPFGHYRERFIPWGDIESFDDSKSLSNILQSTPQVIKLAVKNGDPVSIMKSKSHSDEDFHALIHVIETRNNGDHAAHSTDEAVKPPITRKKGFWQTGLGKSAAVALSIVVILLIAIDIASGNFFKTANSFRLYLIFLPAAVVACWLSFKSYTNKK